SLPSRSLRSRKTTRYGHIRPPEYAWVRAEIVSGIRLSSFSRRVLTAPPVAAHIMIHWRIPCPRDKRNCNSILHLSPPVVKKTAGLSSLAEQRFVRHRTTCPNLAAPKDVGDTRALMRLLL